MVEQGGNLWGRFYEIQRAGTEADLLAFEDALRAQAIGRDLRLALEAMIRWMRGDAVGARTDLEQRAMREKLGPHESFVLGSLLFIQGDLEDAATWLESAKQEGLADPRIDSYLGVIAVGRDATNDARRLLRAVMGPEVSTRRAG